MSSAAEKKKASAAGLEKIPGERYEVLGRIGYGAHGSVFQARDTFLNRLVAIKSIRLDTSLDPEQRKALNKRFIREAQVSAQLHHPNIVTIHDIMFTPETGFIVMEFIEGTTYESLLATKRIGLGTAVNLATQVARALAYAHEHKIIHRDIKPGNIMITPTLEAKIMDFGIAKSDGATNLTMSGGLVGTPDYMSPEQAKGEEVDVRSDVFSLGCVLYESSVGEKPFKGGNLTAVLLSIVNSDPFQCKAWEASNVPPALERVLARALAKDPEERYGSAAELVGALELLEFEDEPAPSVDVEIPVAPPTETPPADSPSDSGRVAATSEEAAAPAEASADEVEALKRETRPLRFAPRLSDELQDVSLTPAQGFVLSRIDGKSRARDIISVSPLPEAEVAGTLSELLGKGLLVWDDGGATSATATDDDVGEPLDDALARQVDRILELGKKRLYSKLLGVTVNTPTADVKHAYLELIQKFHPDAQSGKLSAHAKQKLSRVCAVATQALTTLSGSKARPAPVAPVAALDGNGAPPDGFDREKYAHHLFEMAQKAYDITDYWEAIQLARQALELDDNRAEYHFMLGRGLMKNRNWVKEAIQSIRRASELDPSNAEYFATLAGLYKSEGLEERAATMAAKARELDPESLPAG
jgi:serine/threonine protein kinase